MAAKREKTNMELFQENLKKLGSFFSGYVAIYNMKIVSGGRKMYNGSRTCGDVAFIFKDEKYSTAYLESLNQIYGEIQKLEKVEKYPIESTDIISIYDLTSLRAMLEMVNLLTTDGKIALKRLVKLVDDIDEEIADVKYKFPEVIEICYAAKNEDDKLKLSELKQNLRYEGMESYYACIEEDSKGVPAYYIPSDISHMIEIFYLWIHRTMEVNNYIDVDEAKEIQSDVIQMIHDLEHEDWLNLNDIPLAGKMLYKKNHVMTFRMDTLTGNLEDHGIWGSICKFMFPYITEKTMDKVNIHTRYEFHDMDTYALYVKYDTPLFHAYCRYYEMPSALPVSMDWENLIEM